MANLPISGFPAATALGGTELAAGVQSGANVKITIDQIKTYAQIGVALLTANTFVATQTLTPAANTEALTISGASLTGSNASSFASIAGTWNTSGNVLGALNVTITDTASNARASLIYAKVGSSIKFKVQKDGSVFSNGGSGFVVSSAATDSNDQVYSQYDTTGAHLYDLGKITWAPGGPYNNTGDISNVADTFIRRNAAAVIHFGTTNAASPVAQTLGVQGSRSGTDSNVAGANFTVRSGIGTGNSTGSSLIFQTPLAVASGTGAQTSTTRLTIGPTSSAFTQTVGIVPAADTEALTISGGSITGSGAASFASIAGTWNTSGTPSALDINITNTASNAASCIFRARVGGTNVFSVPAAGSIEVGTGTAGRNFKVFSGGNSNNFLSFGGTTNSNFQAQSNALGISYNFSGDTTGSGGPAALTFGSGGYLAWNSAGGLQSGAADLFLTRSAAANLRLGEANSATPVAQTLGVQGSRSGTDTNVAGANFTVRSGIGTGNSTGSSLILETPTAVASGTGAQTSAARLTLTEASSAFTNAITGTAAATILSGTAIPAGGTAGSGYKFSSTSNFGVFFGSSAPGLAAAKGSLYLRSDGSGATDRAYINTDGGTTWTNLVTAG